MQIYRRWKMIPVPKAMNPTMPTQLQRLALVLGLALLGGPAHGSRAAGWASWTQPVHPSFIAACTRSRIWLSSVKWYEQSKVAAARSTTRTVVQKGS